MGESATVTNAVGTALQFLAGYAEVRGGGCATVTSKTRANLYLAIGLLAHSIASRSSQIELVPEEF